MDFPLQTTMTAPIKSVPTTQQMVADKPKDTPTQVPFAASVTIPAELGVVGAVNASRIAAEKLSIPDIMATERVLKPYGVTMLPSSKTDEKLNQHKA